MIIDVNRFCRGAVESGRSSTALLHNHVRCGAHALGPRLHSDVPRLCHYQYHDTGGRYSRRPASGRYGFLGIFSQGVYVNCDSSWLTSNKLSVVSMMSAVVPSL
jgi:hypothetical protein